MSKKYLLGTTKDREIVFAEFGVSNRNGYPEFSACFDTVEPFTEDDVNATEYYESLVDEMDKEWRYNMCERLNCTPNDLPEALAEADGAEPQDIRDCSIYPEVINVGGVDYYFESCSGGQHDTRGEMEEYVDKQAYERLHMIWDKWHLNGMKAGTPKQEAFVEEWRKTNEYDYTNASKALEEAGLLVDDGYKYGSSWLREDLPEEIIQEVEQLQKILSKVDEELWIADYIERNF